MIKELCQEEAWQLFNSYFKEALKDSGLRSFSFSEYVKVKLLVKGEEPAAILVYREVDKFLTEIDFFATREEYKRKGAAQELLESLKAPELWLELKETNLEALSFYRKHGFVRVGRRESYYENGEAALNMLRK